MKRNLRTILSGILLVSCLNGVAQVDPHFSQYFIQPMTLNPALKGITVCLQYGAPNMKIHFPQKAFQAKPLPAKTLISAPIFYINLLPTDHIITAMPTSASLIPASGLGIITW